jgi:hypothetical protein
VASKGVTGGRFRLISGETRCLVASVAEKEVRKGSKLEKRNSKFGKASMREVEENEVGESPRVGKELFELGLPYTGNSSTNGAALSTRTLR